jgi:hypothetical protein
VCCCILFAVARPPLRVQCINLKACFILKQKWFYLKTRTKSLKIKEINQENPENHLNLGINCSPAQQLSSTAIIQA